MGCHVRAPRIRGALAPAERQISPVSMIREAHTVLRWTEGGSEMEDTVAAP
jgi:hypothetical protein